MNDRKSGTRHAQAQSRDIQLDEAPEGALAINLEGRVTQGAHEGFGQLWEKTYRVRLGGGATPIQAVDVLRDRLPDLQPSENSVFPSPAGVKPGEVIVINAKTPSGPVSTGMLVMESEDTRFVLATPEGHPEAGYVIFSAHEENGETIAQIQTVARASDPLYEIGLRLFGAKMQERIWRHVLTRLAATFDIRSPQITVAKVLKDRNLQWARAMNIMRNATIRTLIYMVTTPFRWLFGARNRHDKRDEAP